MTHANTGAKSIELMQELPIGARHRYVRAASDCCNDLAPL